MTDKETKMNPLQLAIAFVQDEHEETGNDAMVYMMVANADGYVRRAIGAKCIDGEVTTLCGNPDDFGGPDAVFSFLYGLDTLEQQRRQHDADQCLLELEAELAKMQAAFDFEDPQEDEIDYLAAVRDIARMG